MAVRQKDPHASEVGDAVLVIASIVSGLWRGRKSSFAPRKDTIGAAAANYSVGPIKRQMFAFSGSCGKGRDRTAFEALSRREANANEI